jgi:hypothetical protein
LMEAAAQRGFDTMVAMAAVPKPASIRLRSNILHLPVRPGQQIKSPGKRKEACVPAENELLAVNTS